MSVTLASTFRPIKDLPRFLRLVADLGRLYEGITIAVPPNVGEEDVARLKEQPDVHVAQATEIALSRHMAIEKALELSTTHIHYVDMDRALRWLETRPDELRRTIEAVPSADCLIIGRSEAAFETHPQSLQQTEAIVNVVFSHLLGRQVDLCGGSRGLSREAAQYVTKHSIPGRWADAEWPMLLHAAGFRVDYLKVDGLDWETADRFTGQTADPETQRAYAEQIDADAKRWAMRVKIALEQVEAGLEAGEKPAHARS